MRDLKIEKTVDIGEYRNPLITVVVPVYNAYPYLHCCLDSIQRQSYQNLEILLIDDGSTDDSAKICRAYCNQDLRFQLIRQENKGLGPARNTGLDLAKGSYICFVDADDCLHPDYVRILYENLTSTQADFSVCCFESFEGDVPRQPTGKTADQRNELLVLDQMGLLNVLLKEEPATIVVAWNKLVAVDWLRGFHFENKWHEDQFMINEYVRRCNKAVFTSAILYEYRKHPDSIMGKESSRDLRHLDDLEAHEQRIKYFYQPQYQDMWKDLFLSDLWNKISWYMKLYDSENAGLLKKRICPSYAWSFRQYLKIDRPHKIDRAELHLFIFRLSSRLYVFLRKFFKNLRN